MNLLTQQTCKYILSDILAEMKYLPIALAIGLLTGCFLLLYSGRKKKAILYILYIVYLVMLCIITLFKREPGTRLGVSLRLFETIRLLTGRGYFQVDDIFMNTIGAAVGALIGWMRLRIRR